MAVNVFPLLEELRVFPCGIGIGFDSPVRPHHGPDSIPETAVYTEERERAYGRAQGRRFLDGRYGDFNAEHIGHDLRPEPAPRGSSAKMVRVPLARLAARKAGTAVVSNMIALGILAVVTGLVNPESLRNAIALRAPAGTREINRKALELGLRIGQRMSQRYTWRGLSTRSRQ